MRFAVRRFLALQVPDFPPHHSTFFLNHSLIADPNLGIAGGGSGFELGSSSELKC
jgi:hypothetical protein